MQRVRWFRVWLTVTVVMGGSGAWLGCLCAQEAGGGTVLSPRNLEAPFCYLAGAQRSWPVTEAPILDGTEIVLAAKRGETVLAEGGRLAFEGLTVWLSRQGELSVSAAAGAQPVVCELSITLRPGDGKDETQTLALQPAPPARPISYYADFGDDILRIFMDPKTWTPVPITKNAFDQYFRRLQAQGIPRLVIWLKPLPSVAISAEYAVEDWQLYEAQARAIVESEELQHALTSRPGFKAWGWIRELVSIRLVREFGAMLTQSAADHDIALSISFRPFEPALMKYYQVPVFDHDGSFLWSFLPMALPSVGLHPERFCFAHYRKILADMGHAEHGELASIEIPRVAGVDAFLRAHASGTANLRITAASFPPLQEDSFVLQRDGGGRFQLRRYGDIRFRAEARWTVLENFSIESDRNGRVSIVGLTIPEHCRYLILTNPARSTAALDLDIHRPLILRSKSGIQLGRANVYWVLNGDPAQAKRTRVAGIPSNGGQHTIFQAVQSSMDLLGGKPGRRPLVADALVIDRGSSWSPEMFDFNQPATRELVVRNLRSLLELPAFDEIFINTRSHTQLAASTADGDLGLQSIAVYRARKVGYYHLGIDRAYAPRGVADDPRLRALASDHRKVTEITTWQPGAWQGECQSADSPYAWRYTRNKAVASGMRLLLRDLEQAFPKVRIRVVIPERQSVSEAVREGLAEMKRPDGTLYGARYRRHIWGSLNLIPAIGEGMAMVDLNGLRAEPVFLGIRHLPDQRPLALFMAECIRDMAGNHGSSFRGPRSIMYEAQQTLRVKDKEAGRKRREEIICYLLSLREDVREVILYEAADWTYYLPPGDPGVGPHGYLDRADAILAAMKREPKVPAGEEHPGE